MAAIFASEMRAWEGSVTRPEREALVDWAWRTDEEKTSNRHAARAGTRIISPQGNEEAVSVLSACQLGQHPKGSLSDSQRGHLPTPQKRDASGPSAEINESNIWVLWENPTDNDDTRRCALR